MGVLSVGSERLAYQVRESSRAHRLAIVVRPEGIEVVAPAGTPAARVHAFVEAKRRWVYLQQCRFGAELAAVPRPRFVSGAKVLYRGRFLKLRVTEADIAATELRYATGFHVRVPRSLEAGERETETALAVVGWLRRRGLEDARELARRHGARLGLVEVPVGLSFNQRLWGRCTREGVLHLNWRLVAAPRPIFEYVLVHELCHRLERHHGPEFWQLVATLLPDWEVRKVWLERYGRELL